MNYIEKIETQLQLKADVLCYWQMTGDIDNQSGVNSRHLPQGQSLLIFNYGDDIEYLNGKNAKSVYSSPFIVPAVASSAIINQKGKINLFGISFVGDGLFKLIQQPISQIISATQTALATEFQDLQTKLAAVSFEEKINIIRIFLEENINQDLNSPPFQEAIQLINDAKGGITVSMIAQKVCVSERQLQRLFKTRVGISPKDYCKIVRVNNYLNFILNKENTVDWMELVVEYNYHDQPHLINEVKSIAKLSPKKLQQYRDTLHHRYSHA